MDENVIATRSSGQLQDYVEARRDQNHRIDELVNRLETIMLNLTGGSIPEAPIDPSVKEVGGLMSALQTEQDNAHILVNRAHDITTEIERFI